MKKTVFPAQVLGAIAMLPTVVLQMNHVSPRRNTPLGSANKTENTIINLQRKVTGKLSNKALTVTPRTFLLKTTY